jgi:hypothetical protein|nr:MAG TPA: NinB recombination protein [Caudoviricetes sp.]DAU00361.1 MAG TPA: NinB recombination protein [Caudoviricetes sp.]DAX31607.1 MAG TPA: NinB recombination protein [Caudoviricetes sp.]
MIFDLSRELDRTQFKERCNFLYRQGLLVELTEKRGKRTLKQNSYLHLILSYFALQYGERMEWIKQEFFKRHVNPDLFLREKEGQGIGRYYVLRSSSELDTKEMSTAIDRFRDWAAKEAGIYLPSSDEHGMLGEMEREVELNKRWI